MLNTSYLLLLKRRAAQPEPVQEPAYGADDGGSFTDLQYETGNAAAIQFMMLAALAIEELH